MELKLLFRFSDFGNREAHQNELDYSLTATSMRAHLVAVLIPLRPAALYPLTLKPSCGDG